MQKTAINSTNIRSGALAVPPRAGMNNMANPKPFVPSVGRSARMDERRAVSCSAVPTPKSAKPVPKGQNIDFEELPTPSPVQQTVRQAFVLGGVGLHSADYAYVRIMPAHAGEGRYFVPVADGEISRSSLMTEFRRREEELMDMVTSTGEQAEGLNTEGTSNKALQEKILADYLAYLEAVEGGYVGSADEFMAQNSKGLVRKMAEEIRKANQELAHLEPQRKRRSEEEPYIPAAYEFAEGDEAQTTLRNGELMVRGVEHLLAALEACGVDNCRIEVEGGAEVPIVDGAAQGWTTLIMANGVEPCPATVNQDANKKMIPKITAPFTVTGADGAFITAVPDSGIKITAGVESNTVPAIGRQWFCWSMFDDLHFRYMLANAKTFFESKEAVEDLYNRGFVQAGPTNVSIIANGELWHDMRQLTYPLDEPSRHKVVDMMGDLALLNVGGQGGLPQGHVIAYKADHALQVEFVRKLAASQAWEMVPWETVEPAV